ncbi:DUF5710 domain-containing protein [Caulobacter sp. UNC279MFTsu5.1]|uniref:DUF5710 domain-containing protein n=1 Tax=Caulobacter sp. UNC279MFTsu5.1 TaxID=1502775 RepID=UPI0008ECE833|nr:DUF5710 domain-containing protein [Caulobacter sp. UNC279MFTsu5.1]SFK38056.1 hypothetical protein SAMN02799626_04125 [Caulobacter sp. UNC279MFTsu5.1]
MDLKVPYADKDQAEALGARWEPSRRCWYVPDGLDLQPFRRWFPEPDSGVPGLNLRSLEAYVVTAPRRCWRCEQITIVAGFLMAPGFEDFSVWEDDLDGQGRWGGGEGWCFAFYIDVLPSPIAAQAIMHAPRYRRVFSKTTQSSYWANHCSACGALQGDFHLFEDLGGPFLPRDSRDLADQRAFRVKGVFEAGGSFGPIIDVATAIPGVRVGPTTSSPPATKGRPGASRTPNPSILERVRRWLGQS